VTGLEPAIEPSLSEIPQRLGAASRSRFSKPTIEPLLECGVSVVFSPQTLRATPCESFDLFWRMLLIFPGGPRFICEVDVRMKLFPECLPTFIDGFWFVVGCRRNSAEVDI